MSPVQTTHPGLSVTPKITIVDDDQAMRNMLVEYLDQNGMRATAVTDLQGLEARMFHVPGAERLLAHVELLADDRFERAERRGEGQIRDQREHHHRGDRDVPAGERPLTHQQPPPRTVDPAASSETRRPYTFSQIRTGLSTVRGL